MGYHLDFASVLTGQHLSWLVHGIAVTAELVTASWLLAFSLAIILVVIRMSGLKPAEWFVALFVEYHQNVPMLVQLLFWYFAVPELLPAKATLWINERDSELIFAIIALGLCISAYMSEALRSGIRAIPKTQYEAGRVLGLSYLGTMRYIIVPQAIKISAPPLVNYSLLLFKNSSLAMAIGVHELTYQSRLIENDTFRTFEVFTVATVIYLSISLLIMWVGQRFERRAPAH